MKKMKDMIELKQDLDLMKDVVPAVSLSFHPSFNIVVEKLKKWLARFPHSADHSIFDDLFLLYLLAAKKYLDHRNPSHLSRIVLAIHLMQKKLLHSATFFPGVRHLEVRWFPTALLFPFSSKPVLGCLIGFNLMDRYEVFDEENILLALKKHLPELQFVKESSYYHTSQHKNLQIFYFEIEKKHGPFFSLKEQSLLKYNLEEKIKNSIQTLSPNIFMGSNDEDTYKNILVLSQEIHVLEDLPQASIVLEQQTGKEIIFRVTLVLISPFHRFALKDCFFDCSFVPQRTLIVRHLENHPIEAHIFRLHLARDPSLLRSDGSLDFYSARQKVTNLIKAAVGEFRDYNGGIIIKQQEVFDRFKESFPEVADRDPDLMATFFYGITPLEKQMVLSQETLSTLFNYFLEGRKHSLPKGSHYSMKIYREESQIFLLVYGNKSSLNEAISTALQEQVFDAHSMAYNIVENAEGVFFNCVFLQTEDKNTEPFIQALRQSLDRWHQKMKSQQVLRVAMGYSVVSLDPRIGGEGVSGDVVRLLFEGLTRFDQNGNVENGMAESIEVFSNSKEYVFKLRSSLWNDGTPVSAYDFEYAWKKILSPDFKTAFAYLFYPIKNAKEAKEGKLPLDQVGIHVINDRTLKVELVRPMSHFLQLTADSIYSPVHRIVDQQHPQWPYQSEKSYPCNGPFQVKINQPSQGYQLIKNPFYWDANHVAWDQITLKLMTPNQAYQAFQKKEVDWIGNPFGGWYSFYNPGKDDQIVTFPNSMVCWCVFNTANAPFHHPKLREAFAYAIQRSKIVDNSYLPLNPAYSVLLPYYRGSRSLFSDYNPEKARQLMHEALDELGITEKELSSNLTIIFHEKGIREYTASCLKQQFKECLGIDCALAPLPWNALFNKMTSDFQIGLIHWTSRLDDPTDTLNTFRLASNKINFPKWENKEFQRLLELSEQEASPFQRSSYLLKAEEILSQEKPIIPLFYQPNQALVRKGLKIGYKMPCGPFNVAKSSYKEI